MSHVTLCATVNVLETKVGAYCKLAPFEQNVNTCDGRRVVARKKNG